MRRRWRSGGVAGDWARAATGATKSTYDRHALVERLSRPKPRERLPRRVTGGRVRGAAQFHVVTLMTYLISVGGFMHIVPGSMEAFLLALNGDFGWPWLAIEFILPVLLGNIIGGTALFALISYAQVMKEI
jgi:hypothetical protein